MPVIRRIVVVVAPAPPGAAVVVVVVVVPGSSDVPIRKRDEATAWSPPLRPTVWPVNCSAVEVPPELVSMTVAV